MGLIWDTNPNMNKQQLSPLARYKKDIEQNDFSSDSAQIIAIKQLDFLYHQLINEDKRANHFLGMFFKKNSKPLRGLYMWGGVGRGKTYLMDSFYDSLPIKCKKRLHFHRFMYWVHHEFKQLDGHQDPIIVIAGKLARETKILCFDEFFVSDIGDAMILAGLLQEMFKLGITLIATSNINPDRLYWNGLQRTRFLPAIELIKQHCQILNVDGGIDYRLRTLEQTEIYHSPLDEAAELNIQFSFSHLAMGEIAESTTLIINDRAISVRAVAEGAVWFDFYAICATPRSARDFIELSRLYHSVMLSDVPLLDDDVNDQVRRFISLVDEFYERNVKLIISAEVLLTDLYRGLGLEFEFKRTQSRLREMRSCEYLAKKHLP